MYYRGFKVVNIGFYKVFNCSLMSQAVHCYETFEE